jgi:NADH-quinone oxidoreductase subunit G
MLAIDTITPASSDDLVALAAKASNPGGGAAFVSPVKDFYLTNPIARASAVMAECSALAAGGFQQAAE